MGLPDDSWFIIFERSFDPITLEIGPGNPKILLRKSGRWSSSPFLMNQMPRQDLKGSLSGLILWIKKIATLGVRGKSCCVFWKVKR